MWVIKWVIINLHEIICMNISFVINSGSKIKDYDKEQSITFRYRLGRDLDFKKSTGFKVKLYSGRDNKTDWDKSDWDIVKHRVKNRSIIVNRVQVNRFLDRLEDYSSTFMTIIYQRVLFHQKKKLKITTRLSLMID